MMQFLIPVFIIPIAWGLIEGLASREGDPSGVNFIFGHFALYHVLLLLFFSFVDLYFMGYFGLQFLFTQVLIQDAYYFLTSKQVRNEDSWCTLGWGGFRFLKGFYPWTYVILIGLQVLVSAILLLILFI